MNLIATKISWAGRHFEINNLRSLYWPDQHTLVIADLHLGKAAHFRKNGIAMPRSVTQLDIQRLRFLLAHYAVSKLLVVGDLIHAGINSETGFLKEILIEFSQTEVILIQGNHDRIPAAQWDSIGIKTVNSSLQIDGLSFCHDPNDAEGIDSVICGHIHPGISLPLATATLRLPCFRITERMMVLPAFSAFTGMDTKGAAQTVSYAFDAKGIYKVDQSLSKFKNKKSPQSDEG